MSDVMVRRLGPADAAEVERFSEAFDEPVDPGFTTRFLADERHHLVVAYVDGDPAGFVSATEIFHPDKPPELFLNELGVVEGLRRRGAAGSLLAELRQMARELGCASIWVLTDESNEAAVAAYRGAGGEWDGTRQIMFELEPSGE